MGNWLKDWYVNFLSKGGAWQAFEAEECQGLDGLDAHQKAAMIYARLQAAWVNRGAHDPD